MFFQHVRRKGSVHKKERHPTHSETGAQGSSRISRLEEQAGEGILRLTGRVMTRYRNIFLPDPVMTLMEWFQKTI